MAGYQCPFCQMTMALTGETKTEYDTSFEYSQHYAHMQRTSGWEYKQTLFKCPNCQRISVQIYGQKGEIKGTLIGKYPSSSAKQHPEYIPEPVQSDYKEACAIVDLSPKASATLARRCLQGMIRDFWKITKPRLIDEINALEGKVPVEQWKVIDGLRKLGNIGAHMEKDINTIVDIDEDEALKLIKLIELLMRDWYITRHEQQQLYADILEISDQKQQAKTQSASSE